MRHFLPTLLIVLAACSGPPTTDTPDMTSDPPDTTPDTTSDTTPDPPDETPDVVDPPDETPDMPPATDPLTGAWAPGFSFDGIEGGPGSGVRAVLHGDVTYFGGDFDGISGTAARNIAAWDGTQWAALGEGVPITVNALAIDAGGTLYAAGSSFGDFGVPAEPNALFSWDGTTWVKVADVTGDFTRVHTLRVADGSLWVGGEFQGIGGTASPSLAILDIAAGTWSAPAATPDGSVRAILPTDTGVCVGGIFSALGIETANSVACLRDGTWSPLGDGLPGEVYDLIPDGATGELLAAGSFTFTIDPAQGTFIAGLARWDGAAWSPYAGGVNGGRINIVRKLKRLTDDSLLALGSFKSVGEDGVAASHVARYAEGAWTAYGEGVRNFTAVLAPGVEGAYDAAVLDDGRILLGGLFLEAGATISRGVATYEQRDWKALGSDTVSNGVANGQITSMVASADGKTVYAAGNFQVAGASGAKGIAALDVASGTWSPLGLGLDGSVEALALGPNGTLWAGGFFTLADGSIAHLVSWDGTSWSEAAEVDAMVLSMTWAGATLYIGGEFTEVAGVPANRVAKWDGAAWSALGDGVGGGDFPTVTAMAVSPAGELVVGGGFVTPGPGLAIWDGSAWSAYAGGIHDELYFDVRDLVFVGGDLYMAGVFAQAGDPRVTLNSVGRFDGQTWHALGEGFATFDLRDHVSSVAPYGGGLFATGTFQGELGHIAWWDGAMWRPLGDGLSDLGEALLVTPEGLWVSGPFTTAGPSSTYGLAQWAW